MVHLSQRSWPELTNYSASIWVSPIQVEVPVTSSLIFPPRTFFELDYHRNRSSPRYREYFYQIKRTVCDSSIHWIARVFCACWTWRKFKSSTSFRNFLDDHLNQVLLLAFPIQMVLVRVMFSQRAKGVAITDTRVRLTTEVGIPILWSSILYFNFGDRFYRVYDWSNFMPGKRFIPIKLALYGRGK